MSTFARAARSFAAAMLCAAGIADAIECKNHYILSEPCESGWIAASTGMVDLDVHALAIDPRDPQTLYAGGRSGLFKSVNGGQSWSLMPLVLDPWVPLYWSASASFLADHVIKVIAVDPHNSNVLYVATHYEKGSVWFQRRLFKSVDAGRTWSDDLAAQISGVEKIISVIPDPTRPGFLYLGHFDFFMGDTYAPFRTSPDGGATWTYYLEPLLPLLAAHPTTAGTLYGATPVDSWGWWDWHPRGLHKSRDSGATWTATTLVGIGIGAIAVGGGDQGPVYAATFTQSDWRAPKNFEGIFRSTDGGETWIAAGQGPDSLPGTQTTVTALALHPEDADVIYAATSDAGAWRSVDGGQTWVDFSDGLPSLAIRALVTTSGNPSALYAATKYGVFRIGDSRAERARP